MKISVIVPVYGVEPYVRDCLASVGSQKFDGGVECIVVDDCGPDRSMDVVRDFLAHYGGSVDFRIVQRQANGGLSAARNSGLDAATGTHIYFLDSDDELLPDALASISAPLAAHPDLDLIVSPYVPVVTDRSVAPLQMIPGTQLTLDAGTMLVGADILTTLVRGDWFVMAPSKLYNADFLNRKNIIFKESLLHEDELWSFQVAARANSMAVSERPTYLYKLRSGSITTAAKDFEKAARNYLEILCGIRDEVYACGLQTCRLHQDNLQRWLRSVLINAIGVDSKKFYVQMYREARRRAPVRLSDILTAYIGTPCQLVRNFHWLLPPVAAAELLWRRTGWIKA